MFTPTFLKNKGVKIKKFFAEEEDFFILPYNCDVGTLNTLTEGFEMLVVLFFIILFIICLACVSCHCWRERALRTISRYLRMCEILLESENHEKCFTIQGCKTSRVIEILENKNNDSLINLSDWCKSKGILNHGVRHLAVIMDGNRRYGKRTAISSPPTEVVTKVCESIFKEEYPLCLNDEKYNYLISLLRHTTLDGHRRGGEKLMEFIDNCIELNIQMLTVYAFSTENWDRPVLEVNVLMALFYFYFERIRYSAKEKGIFIRFIAPAFERISPRMQQLMIKVEEETRNHSPRNIVVNVCVSYSGRDEILNACNHLAQKFDRCKPISNIDLMNQMLRSITQENHEEEDASVVTDSGGAEPQLLLRTSGEQRLSNFMLYECAYTEFLFINKTWPEVTKDDLICILYNFSQRNRRHGK